MDSIATSSTPVFDRARLDAALDAAFSQPPELGLTLAVVVVHHGEVVAQRYHADGDFGVAATNTLISWSMAKSVTHAIFGILVRDEMIDIYAPAPVAAWHVEPGDPRAAITTEQLLRMTSGLHWIEDYVDDSTSHVIDMLFGEGTNDVAAYAAALPLDHTPGTVWNYSSGTTNILCRIAANIIGAAAAAAAATGAEADGDGGEAAMRAFLQRELFGPLGMTSASPRFDAAGTFVGSSYLYCTARDFARFGELYLANGVVGGHRILPESWIAHARELTPESVVDDTHDYGAQWWLWRDTQNPGAQGLGALHVYGSHGYEGQYILVAPDHDLVVVRLGKTPAELQPAVRANVAEMVLSFLP